MKVDTSLSRYHESSSARADFNRQEIRHCRYLLRRLHFLEYKVSTSGGMNAPDANGGAVFSELEMSGLEFVLKEIGFLEVREPQVSGNQQERENQG